MRHRFALLGLGILLALVFGSCTSVETPTLASGELVKIEPYLFFVIEAEEIQPGEGKAVAPAGFDFSDDGRLHVAIRFDPKAITVMDEPGGPLVEFLLTPVPEGAPYIVTSTPRPGIPVSEQPSGQIIARFGGQLIRADSMHNTVTAYVPLTRIKELAREEAVTEIRVSYIGTVD